MLALLPPSRSRSAGRALNNLGVAYMNQQLFEKALKAFEAAAAKDPALKVAALNRGVALLNLQKLDEAKAVLEKAAKDDPAMRTPGSTSGSTTRIRAQLRRPRSSAFRHVTEIDPNDADTWYFLGSTYAQLKQFPEAIAAFEHALKIDPLHASAQFGLARAYQQSGQADPAHEAMKRFQYVTQKKLGSPISLTYGEQGKYSRAEESPLAVQKVPAQIAVRFVDVTKEAGIEVTKPSQTDFPGYPQKAKREHSWPRCMFSRLRQRRQDRHFCPRQRNSAVECRSITISANGKFEDVTKRAGLGS